MVEIFQFPTREVQFEAGVREMLRLAGLNKEMIDWIWADFIPRVRKRAPRHLVRSAGGM